MNDFNLKEEIKKLGMTQKEFAKTAGIAENTVSQWVRGERSIPPWVKPFLEFYKKSRTLDAILSELDKHQK